MGRQLLIVGCAHDEQLVHLTLREAFSDKVHIPLPSARERRRLMRTAWTEHAQKHGEAAREYPAAKLDIVADSSAGLAVIPLLCACSRGGACRESTVCRTDNRCGGRGCRQRRIQTFVRSSSRFRRCEASVARSGAVAPAICLSLSRFHGSISCRWRKRPWSRRRKSGGRGGAVRGHFIVRPSRYH